MKKATLILVLFFQFFLSFSQEKEELLIFENSENWKREIIKFPIDWAPKVKVSGFEELLFTPKWSDSTNDDFWSLIIGWKINATSSLTIKDIEYNLKSYFDGLMKPNHWSTKFPDPEIHLKKDKDEFFGKMTFFDGFHTGKIITVNIKGSQKLFKKHQKSIITFRLSPKKFEHKIWKNLSNIKIKRDEFELINLNSTWGKEAIRFPARHMDYVGVGEVRFPPKRGWIKPKHPFFWSYTYAWSINVNREIPAKELEIDLVKYFNSLNKIDMKATTDKKYSSAKISKIKKDKSVTYFKGSVRIFDRFATNKMITLNVLVESNHCLKEKKTILLFKFSPKGFTHKTWTTLNKIKLHSFTCNN